MPDKPAITLHWLEKSRSQGTLWLLHELKLPYELKQYKRNPRTLSADSSLKEVHPLGKSPVIEDNGTIIAESGLICDYLVSNFGKESELAPVSKQEEWQVKYYLHHAEGCLMPPLLYHLVSTVAKRSSPFFIKPIVNGVFGKIDSSFTLYEIKLNLDFLESVLKKNGTGYFVGDHLTAADIIYAFPLSKALAIYPDDYPELIKWLASMKKRPAYIEAEKVVMASPRL